MKRIVTFLLAGTFLLVLPQRLLADKTDKKYDESVRALNAGLLVDAQAILGGLAGVQRAVAVRVLVQVDRHPIEADVNAVRNAYFALDGLKWLLGDESLAGETSSEERKSVEVSSCS